jgi:rRNA N6-adenosine-methyltransferase METTL5
MKLKQLESHLSEVDIFETPKIRLEQYPTSAHIASRMLYTAKHSYDDIGSATVVDLGTGTGMLGIAAAIMGAGHVIGIDIDQDALEIAKRNIRGILFGEDSDGDGDEGIDETVPSIDLLHMDVTTIPTITALHKSADTVLLNPPFGTKGNKGIDMEFLRAAFHVSRGAVYSLHKSSTRAYIGKWAMRNGAVGAEPIVALRYDLPKSYDFHTSKAVDVEVDIWRFEMK